MAKSKNILLHELKETVKNQYKKHYAFPLGTLMVLDYGDDDLTTALMYLKIKNDRLELTTNTLEHGIDVDALADFHVTVIEQIYNIVMNPKK